MVLLSRKVKKGKDGKADVAVFRDEAKVTVTERDTEVTAEVVKAEVKRCVIKNCNGEARADIGLEYCGQCAQNLKLIDNKGNRIK